MVALKKLALASVVFCSLLFSSQTFALDIDKFDGITARAEATTFVPDIQSSVFVGAIGGSREIMAIKQAGNQSVSARIIGGFYTHSQDASTEGTTAIWWDRSANSLFAANGLGGIDLFQDVESGTVPKIIIQGIDPDNNPGAVLKLTVFDAAVSSGTKFSQATLTLGTATVDWELSPSDFTVFGSSGAADFKNVGAIKLEVVGVPDLDVSINSIHTNGKCARTPNFDGKVIDDCGVCLQDGVIPNLSCIDCAGVLNGSATPGTSCTRGDSFGPCATGSFALKSKPISAQDKCECKQIIFPSTEICDEIDNNCNGQIDESFPTKNLTCGAGQNGCTFEGKNVCKADGTLFCNAELRQTEILACEQSRGCDGVPESGLKEDECGVCGGDGSSCRDCSGQINGVKTFDRCNVCAGDGTSCLGCVQRDLRQLQTELDNGAKFQERVTRAILAQAAKRTTDKKILAQIRQIRTATHKAQIRNWIISWTLPSDSNECQASFCVNVSNENLITEYRMHSQELLGYTQQALRILRQVTRSKTIGAVQLRRALQLHAENMKLADQVPLKQSSCS